MILSRSGRLAFPLACLLAASLPAAPAAAGSMEVVPVRVQLSPGTRVATLNVRNRGEGELVAQLSAHAWTQENGGDRLDPTTAVAVVPGMVRLAPGAEQVVRVGLMAQTDATRESTFRVLVREIPPPQQSGIGMALQISLPVFVGPKDLPQPPLEWRISDRQRDGVWVGATNRGTSHVQVMGVSLKGGAVSYKSPAMRYVLPGSTMEWRLDGLTLGAGAPASLSLAAETDRGAYEAAVAVGR